MTEREMMYSCILYREVEIKGRELKDIASCLELSYKKAYKLEKAYDPSFEEYNAMVLTAVAKMKNKTREIMEVSRAKTKSIIAKRKRDNAVDYAFHMPISAREQREFVAIAKLVHKDEYLPVGYRKPIDNRQIIIDTPNNYQY